MPENLDDFVSLSTGLEATADIKDNLLKAKEVGSKGSQEFIDIRGSSNPELDFLIHYQNRKNQRFKDLKKLLK